MQRNRRRLVMIGLLLLVVFGLVGSYTSEAAEFIPRTIRMNNFCNRVMSLNKWSLFSPRCGSHDFDRWISSTTWNAGRLACGNYTWRAKGKSSSGVETSWSNTCGFPVVPNTPTGLTAWAVSSTQINLSWNDPGGEKDGYKVYFTDGPANNWSTLIGSTTSTSYQVTGLNASTTYYFFVTAYKGGFESFTSNIASATTQALSCPDPYEPNNSFVTARIVAPGDYQSYICCGAVEDVDYFKFYAATGDSVADLLFSPTSRTARVGEIVTFNLVIASRALINYAYFYISFDPSVLRVVDQAGAPATAIIPSLPTGWEALMNTVDNSTGTIFFYTWAGLGYARDDTFTVATVRFKKISASHNTLVRYVRPALVGYRYYDMDVTLGSAVVYEPVTTATPTSATPSAFVEMCCPVIAYNPSNQTALVVWQGKTSTAQGIYGQFVYLAQGTMGESFGISVTDEEEGEPAVAYNSRNNEYLVVWHGGRFDWQRFIYGQRLSASGTPLGSRIDIATTTNWQIDPAVAYNSVNNEYLIVWEDGTVNLWARRLSNGGIPLGNAFVVTDAPRVQKRPDVAYNPQGNEYLVVWHDFRNNQHWDIWGQRVSAQGTLIGGNFDLCTATANQFNPKVDYAAGLNNYLVTWQDYRNGEGNSDIYARLVLISGQGTFPGDLIAISTEGHHQINPDIAYNEQAGEYLIVWADNRLDFHYYIFGQRVSGQGLRLGGNFDLPASRTLPENFEPEVIPIGYTNAWFIVWKRVVAGSQYSILNTVYPPITLVTPTPTSTPTATHTPTNTPTYTPTNTPTNTPTHTPARRFVYLPLLLRRWQQSRSGPGFYSNSASEESRR